MTSRALEKADGRLDTARQQEESPFLEKIITYSALGLAVAGLAYLMYSSSAEQRLLQR